MEVPGARANASRVFPCPGAAQRQLHHAAILTTGGCICPHLVICRARQVTVSMPVGDLAGQLVRGPSSPKLMR